MTLWRCSQSSVFPSNRCESWGPEQLDEKLQKEFLVKSAMIESDGDYRENRASAYQDGLGKDGDEEIPSQTLSVSVDGHQ